MSFMQNDKVSSYLALVRKHLGSVPTNIQDEILQAVEEKINYKLELHPQMNMDKLLFSIGSPKNVAQRELFERGYKVSSIGGIFVKWFTLSFLTLMVTFALLAFFVFKNFTPFLDIDAKTGRVSFFGGALEMNQFDGSFYFETSSSDPQQDFVQISGSKTLLDTDKKIALAFRKSQFNFETSEDSTLSWNCKTQGIGSFQPQQKDAAVTFDLKSFEVLSCDWKIPEGREIDLEGSFASIRFQKPLFHIKSQLNRGTIKVLPDKNADYQYDLSVLNGIIGEFQNSPNQSSYQIQATVNSGKIDFVEPF